VHICRVSSLQPFSVEIFVRSGGDARFKRLCHPFLYAASAPTLLDAQVSYVYRTMECSTVVGLSTILRGGKLAIGH
jgi:hypothetical protein